MESEKVVKDIDDMINFISCLNRLDINHSRLRSKILFAAHSLIISEDEILSIGNLISFIELNAQDFYPVEIVEDAMEIVKRPEGMDIHFFHKIQGDVYDYFVESFEDISDSGAPESWCEMHGYKGIYSDFIESMYDSLYLWFGAPKGPNVKLIDYILSELTQIMTDERKATLKK